MRRFLRSAADFVQRYFGRLLVLLLIAAGIFIIIAFFDSIILR